MIGGFVFLTIYWGRDQFHFWLAVACLGLGEFEEARRHLSIAKVFFNYREYNGIDPAKLDRITLFQIR